MSVLFSRKIKFTLPRNIRILIVLNTDPQKYFYIMAESGNLYMVKYLVSIGVDVMADNNYAVFWVNVYGRTEVAEYLKFLMQN